MNIKERLLGSNAQYSRFPLDRFIEDTAVLGMKRIDFVPQTPHFFCGYGMHEDAAPLVAKFRRAGIETAVLTPPAYRCSITAPEGEQREATLRYYGSCIALAAELSCRRLVLDASGACWDIEPRQLLANAAEILRAICDEAEKAGVSVLLAPAMGAETPLIAQSPVLNAARELEEMLDRVASPALGVCLDTCVMSSVGDTVGEWFGRLGNSIALVRLCDGNYHGWRAPGEGVLPLKQYAKQIEEAGYTGDFSLYMPGERYIEEPLHPYEKTLSFLQGLYQGPGGEV